MPLAFLKKPRLKVTAKLTTALQTSRTALGRATANSLGVGDLICSAATPTAMPRPWLTSAVIEAFIADEINTILATIARKPGLRIALTEYAPFKDPTAAAERLLQRLETLPWKYELLAPTPLASSATDRSIQLSDDFSAITLSGSSISNYPVQPLDAVDAEAFHRSYPESLDVGRFYFAGVHEGYIRHFGPTAEVSTFTDAWLGLLGLMTCDTSLLINAFAYGGPLPATPIMIYRIDSARELLPYRWLSIDHTATLHGLRPITSKVASNPDESISNVAQAFSHRETRSAARWYLDSHFGSNGLLKVVQATIALEILLGDRTESRRIGLASLLANRLAYLIGYSPSDRERILKNFGDLYDVRSAIVHAGTATLGDAEQRALDELQTYAARAIQRHISELRR